MAAVAPHFSHADHSLSPPRITFPREYNAAVDLVERNLTGGRGEKIAFIDDAGSCSYATLAQQVNRCANAWRRSGLRIEDRAVLLLHDSVDFPTAFLGAIRAGIVPIPCNTLLTGADYEFALSDSRARAVVVSAPLAPMIVPLKGRLPFLEHVIVSGARIDGTTSFADWIGGESAQAPVAPTTPDDVCFWLYSSGSTGTPKGAVHLHSDLVNTAELYARPVLGLRESDIVFSAAKLFFAYGLGNALTFPLAVGATAVLMAERPTPAAVFRQLIDHRPTDLLRRADAVCGDAGESRLSAARGAGAALLRLRRRSAARQNWAGAGASAPASTSSTASARPRCCTSSFPIGRATCVTARPASPSPATPCA